MDKKETLERIGTLPKFILRKTAVDISADQAPELQFPESGFEPDASSGTLVPSDQIETGEKGPEMWVKEPGTWRAVTETDKVAALAFVSGRYKLVQMQEMFKPIAESVEAYDGRIRYYGGYSIMDIFPEQEEFHTADGARIGISAHNSVNKTSALTIRFVIQDKHRILSVPKGIAGFRHVHIGQVAQETKDYIQFVGRIKDSWDVICTKFNEHKVELDNLQDTADGLKLDETQTEFIRGELMKGTEYNLWDLAMLIYDQLDSKNFKSDIHKRKRLDELTEAIFIYSTLLRISG